MAAKDTALAGDANDATELPINPKVGTNKKRIDELVLGWWSTRWRGLNQCRQTKLFFPKGPKKGFTKALLKLDRQELGLWIQWYTGHCWMARHKLVIDDSIDPSCSLCGRGEESPVHLCWECATAADILKGIDIKLLKPNLLKSKSLKPNPATWSHKRVGMFLRECLVADLFGTVV